VSTHPFDGLEPRGKRPATTRAPEMVAYPHWQSDYQASASKVALELSFEDAVNALAAWVAEIDGA